MANSIEMIKDIYGQLRKYNRQTSVEQNKQFYYWVNPTNVIYS